MSTKLKISASEIPAIVKSFYQTNIVPYFRGAPGIGKTDLINTAAAAMSAEYGEEVHVYELHLASMSEVDLRGYLIPSGDNALFTKPPFWRMVEKHKRGILFLDEFAQAQHEVQKAAAPLLLTGRIGEYQLPEGWIVIAAGNRTEDGAGANSLLSHVTNRICIIDVTAPEVDHWAVWAAANNVPFEMIAFAKLRPQIVFDAELPTEADVPYCTARSLTRLGHFANVYPGGVRGLVSDNVGLALAQGFIGIGAAAELAGVVRCTMKLPSFEEIMADPMGARVPDALDESYAAVMLVAVRAVHAKHGDAPIKYLSRFQPNYSLVGLVSLLNRDQKFASTKACGDWVRANKDLTRKFQKYILITPQK